MTNGLIHDLPFADYLAISALSKTTLGQLAITPAHSQIPIEVTTAMRVGTAFHTATLEPEKFDKTYKTNLDGNNIKSFKDKHPGSEFLSKAERKLALDMAKSVLATKTAGNLVKHSEHEVSAVWQHPEYDFKGKNRYDIFRPDKKIIADLKKTAPAEFANLQRTIEKRKYHWQAAWYLFGLWNCLGAHGQFSSFFHEWAFIFIFVESVPPYSVRNIRCTPAMIYQAHEEIRRILPEYDECRKSGVWPGYPDIIEDMDLSDWAQKQFNA